MSDIVIREVYDSRGNLLRQDTRPRTADDDANDTAKTNGDALRAKAQAALATNATYLAHAALPAGTALTTTQLTTIVRLLAAEVDSLAKQNNALIRLVGDFLDSVSDT